jgi:hypothetical protein
MSEAAFICEECNFSTNIPLQWQRHTELASHIKKTGGKPRDKSVKYKCPYCKKEYAFMSKLCVHMNSSCKKKPISKQESEPEDDEQKVEDDEQKVNVSINIVNSSQQKQEQEQEQDKQSQPEKKKCNCEKCLSGDSDEPVDLETMVNRFIDRKRKIYSDDELFHSQVYAMEMYDPTSPPVADTQKINYNAPMPDIDPIMRLIKHSRKMRKYMFSIIYALLEEDFRQSQVVEEVRHYAEKRGFDVFTKDDFHLHVEDRNTIYLRSMKAREKEDGSDIPAYSKVMEKNS